MTVSLENFLRPLISLRQRNQLVRGDVVVESVGEHEVQLYVNDEQPTSWEQKVLDENGLHCARLNAMYLEPHIVFVLSHHVLCAWQVLAERPWTRNKIRAFVAVLTAHYSHTRAEEYPPASRLLVFDCDTDRLRVLPARDLGKRENLLVIADLQKAKLYPDNALAA